MSSNRDPASSVQAKKLRAVPDEDEQVALEPDSEDGQRIQSKLDEVFVDVLLRLQRDNPDALVALRARGAA